MAAWAGLSSWQPRPFRSVLLDSKASLAPAARMAGHGRPPAGLAASSGLERPWAGNTGEAPVSHREEANPFSFKEFVRSKNQNAAATTLSEATSASDALPAPGSGSAVSPAESPGLSLYLDDSIVSPKSLGGTFSFREPFFPDPTITTSLLEDDEDDWSSTYQPLAVEDALLTGVSSPPLGSTFDSFYSDASERRSFSPWQLREGSDCATPSPVGKGDQSKPADREDATDGFHLPHQLSQEELKQENSVLRSKISHLQVVAETQTERVKQLERMLEDSKRKEEKDARDLEAMVQQVEENLQLMTKRAMKAETSAVKLKQENTLLQVQMENYRLENEALRSGHVASLAVVKQNADAALENLLAVLTKSRSSIKQLISGAETLQLVADLLKSIDKISEVRQDSP